MIGPSSSFTIFVFIYIALFGIAKSLNCGGGVACADKVTDDVPLFVSGSV